MVHVRLGGGAQCSSRFPPQLCPSRGREGLQPGGDAALGVRAADETLLEHVQPLASHPGDPLVPEVAPPPEARPCAVGRDPHSHPIPGWREPRTARFGPAYPHPGPPRPSASEPCSEGAAVDRLERLAGSGGSHVLLCRTGRAPGRHVGRHPPHAPTGGMPSSDRAGTLPGMLRRVREPPPAPGTPRTRVPPPLAGPRRTHLQLADEGR